jgi:hypothetical protein
LLFSLALLLLLVYTTRAPCLGQVIIAPRPSCYRLLVKYYTTRLLVITAQLRTDQDYGSKAATLPVDLFLILTLLANAQ